MSLAKLVQLVESKYLNPDVKKLPDFRPGDTVDVHVYIKEGEKGRIQRFQGTVIAFRRSVNDLNGSFTVRKISDGIGVERVFPFHSPAVKKVEVVSKGRSRRAKHYYLRDRTGKSARVEIDYDR